MTVFRSKFYDSNIQIPIVKRSFNVDIKQAYYGGHVDVYKPFSSTGKAYYYDINSLYPTAMLKDMP
ncbi:hypothetical protein HK099_006383, partial [Clydaea vesicula]